MKPNTTPMTSSPKPTGVPHISRLRCGIATNPKRTMTHTWVPLISILRCGSSAKPDATPSHLRIRSSRSGIFGLPALFLGLCLLAPPTHAADSLAGAHAALQAGKADEATRLLNEALKANSNNAEANNLLCRVEYTLQHFDPAAEHCQKAVAADSNDARYHLWLGRAIGERASRASFLSAYSLARKTREEFETAVKLDPRDPEALADLGEFDKEAPGAVGGGIDKAVDVAKKLDAVDPSRAHLLRAAIAEKQKNVPVAEQEFKAAASGPHSAIGWMELANFYRRHERWPDMDSAINSGAAAAAKEKKSAIAYVNGAGILARTNRNPELAIKLFTAYLDSPDKSEEAPAFEVLSKLARLREKNGDHAGAQRDQAAALALAHDYKPAQDISPQEHKH